MGFFSTMVWTRGVIRPQFIQRRKARQAMGLRGFSTVSTIPTAITGIIYSTTAILALGENAYSDDTPALKRP
jgi:hypothetical protein